MSRARTIAQPDPSQQTLSAILSLVAILAASVLALAPVSGARAQSAHAGVGRAALNVAASVSVPVRLKVEQAGTPELVSEDADFTSMDLPVRVAANMAWSLEVSAAPLGQGPDGITGPSATPLQVLDARGNWVPLDGSAVRVLDRRAATNPATFTVRVRLPAGLDAEAIQALRLRLTPAGT